jgi:hypothetical protein
MHAYGDAVGADIQLTSEQKLSTLIYPNRAASLFVHLREYISKAKPPFPQISNPHLRLLSLLKQSHYQNLDDAETCCDLQLKSIGHRHRIDKQT